MNKTDLFIMTKGKYFEPHELPAIKDKLNTLTDSQWAAVEMIQFKEPTTILIVSLLAGTFGIDRFLIGDTGIGIGKLLTCGGFGIWTIVDWFLITTATKQKNKVTLAQTLAVI